jgi:hypothetical protein
LVLVLLGFLVSRYRPGFPEDLVFLGLLAALEDRLALTDLGFLVLLALQRFLALLEVLEFLVVLECLEGLEVLVGLRLMEKCRCNG